MNGAIREIDDLLRMSNGERCRVAARVTRIGACRRVSQTQRRSQIGNSDASRPGAIAQGFELSVPSCNGKPHFDFDF